MKTLEEIYAGDEKNIAFREILYWAERLVIEDDASKAMQALYIQHLRNAWYRWKNEAVQSKI